MDIEDHASLFTPRITLFNLPFRFFPDGKREFAWSHCTVHGSPDLFSIRKSLAPYMGFFP